MRIAILDTFHKLEQNIAAKLSANEIAHSFHISPSPIKDILLENAEVAVLPLQDCPILLPTGLVITALTERCDATYSLLLNSEKKQDGNILDIPTEATIIVPSLLLKKRLSEFFPTATILVADNVLEEWKSQNFDAIVLPSYYLDFLSSEKYIINPLHQSEFVPKAGQGCFAFISRADDLTSRRQLKNLHHSDSVKFTNIERKLQKKWEATQKNGAAFCEKDAMNFYHLYTQFLDENNQILSEKKSSSTLSSWFEN